MAKISQAHTHSFLIIDIFFIFKDTLNSVSLHRGDLEDIILEKPTTRLPIEVRPLLVAERPVAITSSPKQRGTFSTEISEGEAVFNQSHKMNGNIICFLLLQGGLEKILLETMDSFVVNSNIA